MDKELKLAISALLIVGTICVVLIVYSILNPVPSTIETFAGRLDSIEHIQEGRFHSVSESILHFSDGTAFSQDGYYDYAIGCMYKVTYRIAKRLPNNTVLFNPDFITVLSVERI